MSETQRTVLTGGRNIVAVVSLRQASRRLGRTSDYVKGSAEAIDIPLTPVGRAIVMSERDYARLRKHFARRKLLRESVPT